jgi:hypothetical protein
MFVRNVWSKAGSAVHCVMNLTAPPLSFLVSRIVNRSNHAQCGNIVNLPRVELSLKPVTAAALMTKITVSFKQSILPQCAFGVTLLGGSVFIYVWESEN